MGKRITDGVDHSTAHASTIFPYLQPANPTPPGMPPFVVAPAAGS